MERDARHRRVKSNSELGDVFLTERKRPRKRLVCDCCILCDRDSIDTPKVCKVLLQDCASHDVSLECFAGEEILGTQMMFNRVMVPLVGLGFCAPQ